LFGGLTAHLLYTRASAIVKHPDESIKSLTATDHLLYQYPMPAKKKFAPKTKNQRCKVKFCRTCLPCWEHCQGSDDALHEPDMNSARSVVEDPGVVDYTCKHCGQSGSARVKPEDVVFS